MAVGDAVAAGVRVGDAVGVAVGDGVAMGDAVGSGASAPSPQPSATTAMSAASAESIPGRPRTACYSSASGMTIQMRLSGSFALMSLSRFS